MAYCGASIGMCGFDPACADHHCPGRQQAIDLRRFLRQTEGGLKVSDDDSTRVPCNRCTVCAGHCATPEACELPLPDARRSTSIPTIVWARLIGIGLGIGAFVYVIAAMNARHMFL